MVRYDDILAHAGKAHLDPVGAFHPTGDDGAPPECRTLVLFGPGEPGFWTHLTASPEMQDGRPDPVDRWSRRVLGDLARSLGAVPLFPFDGPPWPPFIAWAKRTGRVWSSPVTLLVHDRAGLMLSIRGALAFPGHITLPDAPDAAPCPACAAPCTSACPVGALSAAGYDTAACHAHLDSPEGAACMTQGCAARRACPVSATYPRHPAQSALHMAAFHP